MLWQALSNLEDQLQGLQVCSATSTHRIFTRDPRIHYLIAAVPPAILAIPTSREWSAILSVPPSPFPLLQPLKPSSTLPPREGSTFTERHAWKHCSLKPVLA